MAKLIPIKLAKSNQNIANTVNILLIHGKISIKTTHKNLIKKYQPISYSHLQSNQMATRRYWHKEPKTITSKKLNRKLSDFHHSLLSIIDDSIIIIKSINNEKNIGSLNYTKKKSR